MPPRTDSASRYTSRFVQTRARVLPHNLHARRRCFAFEWRPGPGAGPFPRRRRLVGVAASISSLFQVSSSRSSAGGRRSRGGSARGFVRFPRTRRCAHFCASAFVFSVLHRVQRPPYWCKACRRCTGPHNAPVHSFRPSSSRGTPSALRRRSIFEACKDSILFDAWTKPRTTLPRTALDRAQGSVCVLRWPSALPGRLGVGLCTPVAVGSTGQTGRYLYAIWELI
jgi:hypothetical protein